jgi:curved DNA-binding protein
VAYRLLAKKLHPDVNGASEEATRRVQELNAAHEVLSDPKKRRDYDRALTEEDKRPEAPKEKIQRDIKQDVLLRIEEFFRGANLTVKVNDPGNPHGEEIYHLEVPPDTAPGERFRLPRSEPFEGGHVTLRVKARPDYRFKARGSDLRCDLRISTQRAAQGGTEMTPGPQGRLVKVHVPAGVKRGAVLKVAGEGLPKPRGGRGDLLVRVTYRPEVKVMRR